MAYALQQLLNEEDSSGDELFDAFQTRPRWIRERSEFFDDYDDVDFQTRFRLSKRSTLAVLAEIEHALEFPSDRYCKTKGLIRSFPYFPLPKM